MPGVPLDVMDKFKALFRRKKDKPATGDAPSTHTEPPKPTEATAAAPQAGQTPQNTTAAPSDSNPTAPAASAVPIDTAGASKPIAPPAPVVADPIPQATSSDAAKAPTSTTV